MTWWRVLPPPEQPSTSTLLFKPLCQVSVSISVWAVSRVFPRYARRGSRVSTSRMRPDSTAASVQALCPVSAAFSTRVSNSAIFIRSSVKAVGEWGIRRACSPMRSAGNAVSAAVGVACGGRNVFPSSRSAAPCRVVLFGHAPRALRPLLRCALRPQWRVASTVRESRGRPNARQRLLRLRNTCRGQ